MTRERTPSKQTLLLLSDLLRQPRQWVHGYDLSMATGLKSGTLYPILMRLCDRELLEHKWQDSPDPGRPPRHMYRLTASGVNFARQQLADREFTDVFPAVSPRSPA
jgi:PadR family transcriptional regulator, regulatory protein PadR